MQGDLSTEWQILRKTNLIIYTDKIPSQDIDFRHVISSLSCSY
jgi:hypothetical protein